MPEYLIALPTGALLRLATLGFCGKLPARGDFVGSGLPRGFVEPWHDWMQRSLAISRRALGKDWVSAWNEAPIWRFALSPGVCGPDAALGLWMPSVDAVGRQFPLTFAALTDHAELPELLAKGGAFFDVAEAAGLDALAHDIAPEEIAARLAAETWTEPRTADLAPELWGWGGAMWWTKGGPRVPACAFPSRMLGDGTAFARMLQAGAESVAIETGAGGPE